MHSRIDIGIISCTFTYSVYMYTHSNIILTFSNIFFEIYSDMFSCKYFLPSIYFFMLAMYLASLPALFLEVHLVPALPVAPTAWSSQPRKEPAAEVEQEEAAELTFVIQSNRPLLRGSPPQILIRKRDKLNETCVDKLCRKMP